MRCEAQCVLDLLAKSAYIAGASPKRSHAMMGFDVSWVQAVSAGVFVTGGLAIAIAALRAGPRVRPVDEDLLDQAHRNIDRSRLSNVLSERKPQT